MPPARCQASGATVSSSGRGSRSPARYQPPSSVEPKTTSQPAARSASAAAACAAPSRGQPGRAIRTGPRADAGDGGGEHRRAAVALLRERRHAGGQQRGDVGDRPAGRHRDRGRAGRRRGRPGRRAPDQERLERGPPLRVEQRREAGEHVRRARGVRDDERRGRRRHSSWNRYTTPAGASAAASIRGSASASRRAKLSVLAAISSSRRSTGVASACTPFA